MNINIITKTLRESNISNLPIPYSGLDMRFFLKTQLFEASILVQYMTAILPKWYAWQHNEKISIKMSDLTIKWTWPGTEELKKM